MITRGFQPRRSRPEAKRLPLGQHLTADFPVLSAGPTPQTPLNEWTFTVEDEDGETIASWDWDHFRALGPTEVTVDIHCVTRWSKFDTRWRGVTVERIFEAAGLEEPPAPFVMAFCDGNYTTNLPVEDVLEGKAMVAWEFDGEPLDPEHGGPARLLVPHLYFWKSAKWVRALRFMRDPERELGIASEPGLGRSIRPDSAEWRTALSGSSAASGASRITAARCAPQRSSCHRVRGSRSSSSTGSPASTRTTNNTRLRRSWSSSGGSAPQTRCCS